MVEIKLHDGLGDFVGKTWKLNVKKVSEALHAINCLSNGKLYNYLHKHGADSFQVVVNGRVLEGQETFDPQDPEIIQKIKNSIYNIKLGQLKTIDIVPVYKLADQNTLGIVLGVVLIIVGILVAVGTLGGGAPLAAALIIGGIGIIAAGVINLLSKPPIFEDFREIQQGGKSSYLFNGPENTVKEGGPVPIGFGTLTVGSQVVSANYEIEYYATNFESTPVSNGLIRAYNFGGLDISYYKSISTAYPNPFFEQEAAPGTEVIRPNVKFENQSAYSYNITASTTSAPTDVYKTYVMPRQEKGTLDLLFDLGSNFANKKIQIILHFADIAATSGSRLFNIKVQRVINGILTEQYLTTVGTVTDLITDANTDWEVFALAGGNQKNLDSVFSDFAFDDNGRFRLIMPQGIPSDFGDHEAILNGIRIHDETATF